MSRRKRHALGLAQGALALVSYDRHWPALFTAEARRLKQALGDGILAIEHIGSTAVPGLAAKPVIDMMAAVADSARLPEMAKRLAGMGYEDLGEAGVPGRGFFVLGPVNRRTHHLSLVGREAGYWGLQILFRDYLRAHADSARAYAALKAALQRQPDMTRERYTDSKTDFVRQVIMRAERERAERERAEQDLPPPRPPQS